MGKRPAGRGSIGVAKPSPPAAVVFDCDGLLLDTEAAWTAAESTLFERYGRTFGLDDKRALVGSSAVTGGLILERLLDQPGRAEELSAELLALAAVEYEKGAAPLPGAAELVGALRGGVPVAVATNTPRALVEPALVAAGFDGAFDAVVGADDVPNPKPAPDVYLAACERLGVLPTEAIAFEDSPTGVAAARAAGLYVVGVPSLPGLALDADEVLDSLASVDLPPWTSSSATNSG